MKFLYEKAIQENISHSVLKALGIKAEKSGIRSAKKYIPKQYQIGRKSWLRVEPLQKGKRIEIHLEDGDDIKEVIKRIEKSA